jgi:NADH-quinone oxidoreductase subunit K
MNETALLVHYLVVGAVLVGVGSIGFIVRRNLILMFLSLEMILQGVSLSLVAWSRFHNDFGGQILVLFIIGVAAAEAAIALALVLVAFRESRTLDALFWTALREPGVPAPQTELLSEAAEVLPERKPTWPSLAVAGLKPQPASDEEEFRPTI